MFQNKQSPLEDQVGGGGEAFNLLENKSGVKIVGSYWYVQRVSYKL